MITDATHSVWKLPVDQLILFTRLADELQFLDVMKHIITQLSRQGAALKQHTTKDASWTLKLSFECVQLLLVQKILALE